MTYTYYYGSIAFLLYLYFKCTHHPPLPHTTPTPTHSTPNNQLPWLNACVKHKSGPSKFDCSCCRCYCSSSYYYCRFNIIIVSSICIANILVSCVMSVMPELCMGVLGLRSEANLYVMCYVVRMLCIM